MNNPWKPDPNDDRTPIAPPDTVGSMPYTEALQRVSGILDVFCVQVLLELQAAVDRAQKVIAHVLAVGHMLADGLSFAQEGFGSGHAGSVGLPWGGAHTEFLQRMNLSRHLLVSAKNFDRYCLTTPHNFIARQP